MNRFSPFFTTNGKRKNIQIQQTSNQWAQDINKVIKDFINYWDDTTEDDFRRVVSLIGHNKDSDIIGDIDIQWIPFNERIDEAKDLHYVISRRIFRNSNQDLK